jgi:hypothetical protein
MGQNNFDPRYDDDEERISLVNVAAPVSTDLELKSDSESDDEKL